MDYNVVRQRKMENGGAKKNGSKKYIIIISALLLVCLTSAALLVKELVKPETGGNIGGDGGAAVSATSEPQETVTEEIVAEPVETPPTEEPVIPTPEPVKISGRGSMEPIPEDVWALMQGRSWTENPNVGYDDLMYLTLPYYDFNYEVQTGHMICAKAVAEDVVNIFSDLFDIKYPIERMEPVDKYFDGLTETFDTPDRNSMGHNNTSCFYYRVVSGRGTISNHAYGRAIDLNPKTNPWELNGNVSPRNAYKYAERGQTAASTDFSDWTEAERAAFIGTDTEVYRIFRSYGWEWGGEIWGSEHDYQHFQKR